MYLTTYTNNTILVYDVSDPWSPTLQATVTNASIIPSNIAIDGQYMYVSEFNSVQPIGVWDIYSSSTPIKIGMIGYGNFGFSNIITSGEYVYVLDHNAGVNSFDIFPAAHLQAQSIHVGSTYTGQLEVGTDATLDNRLSVFGDVMVGGGVNSKGFSSFSTLQANTVTATTMIVANTVSSQATSTLRDGNGTGGGSCQVHSDVDGSGFTYCTWNNGVQTCSTTSCQ
jgi:hypothetical protein